MEVDEILKSAAATFEERSKIYGSNYVTLGEVFRVMFKGKPPKLETASDWSRFYMVLVIIAKITRYINSGSVHLDSIHDIVVYAAMIERQLRESENHT